MLSVVCCYCLLPVGVTRLSLLLFVVRRCVQLVGCCLCVCCLWFVLRCMLFVACRMFVVRCLLIGVCCVLVNVCGCVLFVVVRGVQFVAYWLLVVA